MQKTAKWAISSLILLMLCITALSVVFHMRDSKKIAKIEDKLDHKEWMNNKTLEVLQDNLTHVFSSLNKRLTFFPANLADVPCSQEKGIVLQVRTIDIDGIPSPYNPSIIEGKENDYYLFFRHDIPIEACKPIPFHSYIGFARLDKRFNAVEVVEKLNTKSKYSEDPRIVKIKDTYYLSYNDLLSTPIYCRSIHIAKWNPESQKLSQITNLDQHIQPIEKNWMPFEYTSGGNTSLHFVYSMYPHKILHVQDPKKNIVQHLTFEGNPGLQKITWTDRWGKVRGGTPAKLIDNEYLAFFHSSFTENDTVWYVMGAYTFEAKPPFRIKSISSYPILFKGIYDTVHCNTANHKLRCIFPSGFVVEKKNNRTILHVSCGENDSAVKMVTIDYEKLKEIMVKVENPTGKKK